MPPEPRHRPDALAVNARADRLEGARLPVNLEPSLGAEQMLDAVADPHIGRLYRLSLGHLRHPLGGVVLYPGRRHHRQLDVEA